MNILEVKKGRLLAPLNSEGISVQKGFNPTFLFFHLEKKNHRITEQLKWEGTSAGHLVHPPTQGRRMPTAGMLKQNI